MAGLQFAIPSGEVILTRNDGTIQSKASYRNGLLEGEMIEYYEDGKTVCMKKHYEAGTLNGTSTFYNREGQKTVEYHYTNGSLDQATEYLNQHKIGVFRTGNMNAISDREIPLGYLLHMEKEQNPAEIYPGTTWIPIESDILEVQPDGTKKQIQLWMRSENSKNGPYVMVGEFQEFRNQQDVIWRKGEHTRQLTKEGILSVLKGEEVVYREDASTFLSQQINMGVSAGVSKIFNGKNTQIHSLQYDETSQIRQTLQHFQDVKELENGKSIICQRDSNGILRLKTYS